MTPERSSAVCEVDGAGRVLRFSAEFGALTGRPASALPGTPVEELLGEPLPEPGAEAAIVVGGIPVRVRREPLLGGSPEQASWLVTLAPVDSSVERDQRLDHVARAQAEEAQRRLSFLYQASAALFAEARSSRQTLEKLAKVVVPDLGDWCFVDEPLDGGFERVAASHWNPALEESARAHNGELRIDPDGAAGLARVAREGIVERVPYPAPPPRGEEPEDLRRLRALNARSWLIVPLRVGGQTLAVMTLVFAESTRSFTDDDVAFVSDLAGRAAFALENARLFEQVRHAVRAREDLLSVVSHDLKNPMSAIVLRLQRLRRVLADPAQESARQLVDKVEHTVGEMNRLIESLLDSARLEAGRMTLSPKPTEPGPLVSRALETLEALAAEKRVRLTVRVPPELPKILCDPDRLAQVLANLVGNAIKFTEAGGEVQVRGDPDGESVLFAVQDSGQGIAPEDQPHLFERYWQSKPNARAGHGLGLSIAKGIVDAHGGRIWVSSQPGHGATFFFTIPALASGASTHL